MKNKFKSKLLYSFNLNVVIENIVDCQLFNF